MKIQGKFLYYDVMNSNDRIYTKECAKNIVKQFEEMKYAMFGQIGYPDVDNFARGYLGEVSHQVKEIHLNPEEKTIEGTIEILDKTPNGRKLLNLIDNDIKKFNETYVIRSRGTGEINENKEVVNFNIISFDVVLRDSDAFLDVNKPLKLE
jgi:hypothetical protein